MWPSMCLLHTVNPSDLKVPWNVSMNWKGPEHRKQIYCVILSVTCKRRSYPSLNMSSLLPTWHFPVWPSRSTKKWSVVGCPYYTLSVLRFLSLWWTAGALESRLLWSCGYRGKIHLFVSGNTEMLPIPPSSYLQQWKALNECFLLWRHPCTTSSLKLPLLGAQVPRLSAVSWLGSLHCGCVCGGNRTKGLLSF